MERLTARAVMDLHLALSKEEQGAFLRMLGAQSTSAAAFLVAHSLPDPERDRYIGQLFEHLARLVFPLFAKAARELCQEVDDVPDDEFDELVARRVSESMNEYIVQIRETISITLKKQRDRKSDPENVRRNVEICDRRQQDPKKWTLGRLGKDYSMTRQSVVNILKEEAKWKRLLSQL